MKLEEAVKICEDFGVEYFGKDLYLGAVCSKEKAVEGGLLEVSEGESSEGLCLLVLGSVDKLPDYVQNPYKSLPIAYIKEEQPVPL